MRQHCITFATDDTAHSQDKTYANCPVHLVHQKCTHQELIKRQRNKPERKYQELLPGTPVWVQHRQNATWEPAIEVNKCAPNSYWIMQENGAEQPKVYRLHQNNAENKIYSH